MLIVDREEADNGLFSTKRTWEPVQKEGLQPDKYSVNL